MNARFGFVLAIICAGFLTACGGGGGGGSSTLPVISPTATPAPSGQPSATPPAGTTPSSNPSATPTGQPTGTPTVQPTGTPTTHPTATPVPTPTVQPTATPTVAPASVTVAAGPQATSAPIPSGASLGGSVIVPTGSGTLTITGQTYTPNGVNNGVGQTTLAYFILTAQGGAVTLHGLPGFTIANKTGGGYFAAYYDTSSGYAVWESTTTAASAADANRNVNIPSTGSPTVTIPAGSSMYLAVYIGSYIPPVNVAGCVGGNERPLTKTRSLVGVHPITSGNAFSYSGALTQTIVRSSPCPMPTATANAQVAVTVNETAPPGSAPAGTQIDEHSVETNAFSTYTQTISTDSYVASSLGSLIELGENAVDQGGNSVATSYSSSGLKFGQVPEAAGNQWSNAAPSTVVSNLADGSRYARTYAPSGTYSETDVMLGGLASNITENADGSGSYLVGTYDQYGSPTQFPITISAPSGNTITMTYKNTPHTIPLWYSTPFTPYSDVTQDMGLQAIDSACGTLPSGFNPGLAEKIVRTTTVVDAVLGYTDTRTTTTWDQNPSAPQGPLCVKISDVENFYYDYMLDTNFIVYRTTDANPIQTNTINEIYALGSAPTANSVRRSASESAFRAQVAAGQAGITFARSVERAGRLTTFAHALRKARLGGRQ